MEKILEMGNKYKYEIISVIVVGVIYVLFTFYSKKENKVEKEEKKITKEIVETDSSKKELRLLISEIRKMSLSMKEMLEYNKKLNPKDNYFSFRNEYITRDIEKIRILIDTKSMGPHHDDEHTNTSEYKVLFGVEKEAQLNTISFGYSLNNVIGFRLTRATIPDTLYNVTTTNQRFRFSVGSGGELDGILREGAYTFQSLAVEFQRALNEAYDGTDFVISSDIGSFKYTIDSGPSSNITFYWNSHMNQVHKLIGGSGGTETITTLPHTFRNTVDHSVHFVDLVIPEIPSVATKISASGKNIIDRIPLTGIRGNLVTYIPLEEGTPWTQNFFYPINLNKLSISLFDDTTNNLLKNNNNDHMLEFEVAILKNTKLLK